MWKKKGYDADYLNIALKFNKFHFINSRPLDVDISTSFIIIQYITPLTRFRVDCYDLMMLKTRHLRSVGCLAKAIVLRQLYQAVNIYLFVFFSGFRAPIAKSRQCFWSLRFVRFLAPSLFESSSTLPVHVFLGLYLLFCCTSLS